MDYMDFDRSERKTKHRKIIVKIVLWIVQIAAAVGLAFLVIRFAVEKTTMLGISMDKTLQDNDEIIINRVSYLIGSPSRFDVIVFKQSGKEHSYYNIKRVIGLPGETIQIKDGYIYINEVLLEEPINTEPMNVAGLAEEPFVLEEDEYFVLGDNRNNSEDSRFANIGTVVKDDIVGKAWLKTEPEFGFISKLNLKGKEAKSEED